MHVMTSGTRTLSEAERREQILSAARAVFNEKGYETTTISDIVSRAGVAQGTFYLYFPSKREIVWALANRPMEIVAERVQATMTSGVSFEEMLRGLIKIGFGVGCDYPDLCRLLHIGGEASKLAEQTPMARDIKTLGIRMFAGAIEKGEMEPMDPQAAFELFQAMLKDSMQRAFGDSDCERVEEIEDALTKVVTRAFVKAR